MTYAVWNLGGGVCVGIEPCDPEEGPVTRLTAAQLHRLALYVQIEIDIAQEDEAKRERDPNLDEMLKARSLREMQRRDEVAEVQHQTLKDSIRTTAAKENAKLVSSICGEPRMMGGVNRYCDRHPGHASDFHSVTLEELGGGTSQWPVDSTGSAGTGEGNQSVAAPVQDAAVGRPAQPVETALDPALPLFAPHDAGLPLPPDPDKLVRRRESEQQKRELLLAAGWTEHRDIYDQNIAECWEHGGKWVDVHHAFEQILAEKARAELTRQGWLTAEARGDGVERWVRPGGDISVHNEAAQMFQDALREIGIDPSFLMLPALPIDQQRV